jgi:hypothetical protein
VLGTLYSADGSSIMFIATSRYESESVSLRENQAMNALVFLYKRVLKGPLIRAVSKRKRAPLSWRFAGQFNQPTG